MPKKPAVLVTGAGSGIGQAAARLFSEKGYFVYLTGRTLDHLHQTQSSMREPSMTIVCDLRSDHEIERMADQILNSDRGLDVIINNAGIYLEGSTIETKIEVYREVMTVNFFSHVKLTQKLLPPMMARRSGSIVNVSSTLSLRPSAQSSAYCASKAALNAWTQSLAIELGPFQIPVNAVCPGIVDTPIHAFNALPASERAEGLTRLGTLQPLGRIGSPEEIAEAIYSLAHLRWTTGALLNVDGGINLV